MVNEFFAQIILAIVQAITEWLPVSSSGHLVVAQKLLDYEGGLVFDVALHFGTLMAVFVYFGKDLVDITREFISGRWGSGDGRIGLLLIVATIPAAIVGFLFERVFTSAFASLTLTAIGFGVTGLFLLIASLDGREKKRDLEKFGFSRALSVGVAQVFALFPGVSRSGSTIASGILAGLSEKDAMKFSFLMSIPVILGANVLVIGNDPLPSGLIWATLTAFVVGLLTIHLLYKKILTSKKRLRWFAGYALILSVIVGVWVLIN